MSGDGMDNQDKVLLPDEIWADDLFGRRAEAELLIGYLESVTARAIVRDDLKAYTIALDAPYGEGKSFFLRRFAKHLQLNHPVAFIDAWADDLADDPLVALAATLKHALDPLIQNSADVRGKWDSTVEKMGKVAKIASRGLLKRGIGLLITASAAEALDGAMLNSSEMVQDAVKEALTDVGNDTVDEAIKAYKSVTPSRLMNEQIDAFEAGQFAIQEMKRSLRALVESLDGKTNHAPIVIIIDELDRCRPTYAIKLLEEIKHLFDVPGLLFIFGMNRTQLAHSLSGAYGPNFNGEAYLRRFIGRHYRISTPDLTPLLKKLIEDACLNSDRFLIPPIRVNQKEFPDVSLASVLKKYMDAYGLVARDAFEIVDILQTCAGITHQSKFLLGYLLPLIFGRILGCNPGEMRAPTTDTNWDFVTKYTFRDETPKTTDLWKLANDLEEKSKMSMNNLHSLLATPDIDSYAALSVLEARQSAEVPLARPENYGRLLETVGRFSNTQLGI